MKTPLEILQDAASESFTWVDCHYDTPVGMPLEEPGECKTLLSFGALSASELSVFESGLPAPLPPDIRDLLVNYSGFSLHPDVSFTDYNTWQYSYILPHVIVLANDGCGNDWVIEIDPISGRWEHVWYGCHDPCDLTYQCKTLGEFIEGVLDLSRLDKFRMGHRSVLDCPRTAARRPQMVSKIRNPTPDDTLARFVSTLHENDVVIDMRNPQAGDYFNVWEIPPNQPIKRYNQELLFSYRKEPTFWQRLTGRSGK